MEPENLQSPLTIQAQPQPKKKIHILLILILFGILTVGGIYFFGLARTTHIKPMQLTGLEVAQKIAVFLDKTLAEDGSILEGYSCADNKCVPMAEASDQSYNGTVAFAYFTLAEATGDQSYEEKANGITGFSSKRCEGNPKDCGGQVPQSVPPKSLMNDNELSNLYGQTGDIRYRDKLLEQADKELENLSASLEEMKADIQRIQSVILPAYDVSGDEKYLIPVMAFFDNLVLSDLGELENDYVAPSAAKAADILLTLGSLSRSKIDSELYRNQAVSILEEILAKLWDAPENLKYNGDYGFVVRGAADYKPTILNAELMETFAKMGSVKFNLK